MSAALIVSLALYLAVAVFLLLNFLQEEEFWESASYYKPDAARGGFVRWDGQWIERKVFWREWGTYFFFVFLILLSPFIALYLVLGAIWDGITSAVSRWAPAKRGTEERPAQNIFSGGDGSSAEEAVVINTDDPLRGVRWEYLFIEAQCGPRDWAWKRELQVKVKQNGREFDVVTIKLRDGEERVFWFDITRFSGRCD